MRTSTNSKDGPGWARRLTMSIMLVMLVTTPIGSALLGGAAPVQNAAAATNDDGVDCTVADDPVDLAASVLIPGFGYLDSTVEARECQYKIEEMQNKSQDDLYAADLGAHDLSSATLTTRSNWLEEMDAVAMSRARYAVAESIEDGDSESQAIQAARSAVQEYYARQQQALLAQYERHYRTMYATSRSAYAEDITTIHLYGGPGQGAGLPDADTPAEQYEATFFGERGGEGYGVSPTYYVDGMRQMSFTLVNGTTVSYPVFGTYDVSDSQGGDSAANEVVSTALTFKEIQKPASNISEEYRTDVVELNKFPTHHVARVVSQSSTGSTETVARAVKYRNMMEQLEEQYQRVSDNAAAFADSAYSEYQQGDLSLDEVAGPTAIASQAASDYNSTGYYAYASTIIGSTGASTNLTASMNMTVRVEEQIDAVAEYRRDDVFSPQTATSADITVTSVNLVGGAHDFDGADAETFKITVDAANTANLSGVNVAFISQGDLVGSYALSDADGDSVWTIDLADTNVTSAQHDAVSAELMVAHDSDGDGTVETEMLYGSSDQLAYTTTGIETYEHVTGQVLFDSGANVSVIETDTTYQAGDFEGPMWVVWQTDSGSELRALTGESSVTIHSMTDIQSGESINQTQTETTTYDNLNGSDLKQQLDALETWYEEYQTQTTSGGAGPGTGIDIGFGGIGGVGGIVVIALAAGIIVLLVLD